MPRANVESVPHPASDECSRRNSFAPHSTNATLWTGFYQHGAGSGMRQPHNVVTAGRDMMAGNKGMGRGYWGPLAHHRDATGQSVTPVTYGMLIFGQETGNLRRPFWAEIKSLMRRNAMTRA